MSSALASRAASPLPLALRAARGRRVRWSTARRPAPRRPARTARAAASPSSRSTLWPTPRACRRPSGSAAGAIVPAIGWCPPGRGCLRIVDVALERGLGSAAGGAAPARRRFRFPPRVRPSVGPTLQRQFGANLANDRRRGPWRCRASASPDTARGAIAPARSGPTATGAISTSSPRSIGLRTRDRLDRVLIDGEDVVGVELHLPDDAAPVRQCSGRGSRSRSSIASQRAPSGCGPTGWPPR